ncbi:MAG TPA: alpha-2-macroglobulin, partial [Agriterribacter sp.]|nr:alpha-2-macroglobulin [Agriterribacter sp.]
QQFTVTQKELMVQPNAPRFVREKDHMAFSAKVVNVGDRLLNGFTNLELFDAATNKPVNDLFQNAVPVKEFSVTAGQSTSVEFMIKIPENFNSALGYRITASSSEQAGGKALSDGEENVLPVLNNRMLLTETLPLNMRGTGTKQFKFEKLLQSSKLDSSSVKNYGLTVEYTANPAWYAVQSLPYLAEYPYECAEQTFNRYYANTLASFIANRAPRVKAIFDKWRNDTSKNKALVSPLEKNEELKSILLQETPWLVQAKNETDQKKNIALLFDMVRMSTEAETNFNKLKDMQTPNGGFVWFKGGNDDRYITQYILTGIGHLQKLNALPEEGFSKWNETIEAALHYTDQRIKEDYEELTRDKADLKKNHLSNTAIQYLYMRSFFPGTEVDKNAVKAYNYYKQQAKLFWLKQSKYLQGMIALALDRGGDQTTAKSIIASLKENAATNEELGMYWKDNRPGYYWHEAPVETQSLLIEAFSEIANDKKAVGDMKLWLLKQKQTQHWSNTRATAEACYALLLQGNDWLSNEPNVQITLGSTHLSSGSDNEDGTGYIKKRIDGENVQPQMGNISVTVTAPSSTGQKDAPVWGAVYWQYFEDLDKVTSASTNTMPLQLRKQLFAEKNTGKGPVLYPVTDSSTLKVGDKLKVRIELRADRDMEYVHMKDLRASGTEPVHVLSSYKWQGGLGYYESTKDAATNFFFSWLSKGTYVFEYPLFVTHEGNFSAGVATIQCMYAPEFAAHSNGVRINVK